MPFSGIQGFIIFKSWKQFFAPVEFRYRRKEENDERFISFAGQSGYCDRG
jgi:hypothetical protein